MTGGGAVGGGGEGEWRVSPHARIKHLTTTHIVPVPATHVRRLVPRPRDHPISTRLAIQEDSIVFYSMDFIYIIRLSSDFFFLAIFINMYTVITSVEVLHTVLFTIDLWYDGWVFFLHVFFQRETYDSVVRCLPCHTLRCCRR